MSLDSTMDKVLQRRAEVEERLSQAAEMTPAEMANLSRELTELRPVCEQIELVNRLTTEIADAQMMVDEAGDDAEMAEMARAELDELSDQLPAEQDKLQLLLLPKDKDDSRNAILEVRAGTGHSRSKRFVLPSFLTHCITILSSSLRSHIQELSAVSGNGFSPTLSYVVRGLTCYTSFQVW